MSDGALPCRGLVHIACSEAVKIGAATDVWGDAQTKQSTTPAMTEGDDASQGQGEGTGGEGVGEGDVEADEDNTLTYARSKTVALRAKASIAGEVGWRSYTCIRSLMEVIHLRQGSQVKPPLLHRSFPFALRGKVHRVGRLGPRISKQKDVKEQ